MHCLYVYAYIYVKCFSGGVAQLRIPSCYVKYHLHDGQDDVGGVEGGHCHAHGSGGKECGANHQVTSNSNPWNGLEGPMQCDRKSVLNNF